MRVPTFQNRRNEIETPTSLCRKARTKEADVACDESRNTYISNKDKKNASFTVITVSTRSRGSAIPAGKLCGSYSPEASNRRLLIIQS